MHIIRWQKNGRLISFMTSMSSVSTKLVHKSIETDNLFSLTTGMVLELSTQAKEDLLLNQVTNKVKNKKQFNIEWLLQAFPE